MKTISLRSKVGIHALGIALVSGPIMTASGHAQEALPTGGQVVSGSATINTNGPSTVIDQSSDRMIANWDSFSIGKNNSVIFNQPDSNSVALNRVIGQDPSRILGSLTANGQVFLLNPNGIMIGKGGSVQTGGFVGSTLDMSNTDFLNGAYRFTGTGGSILNQGDLKGGVVALISPRVTNEGTITGSAALAAGTDVTLDFDGDGLISVEVSASSLATLVENNGLIEADGGVAILTAKGANDAMKGVVNNSGVVEAQSLSSRDGRILLLGGMEYGEVQAGGTLRAKNIETSASYVDIDAKLVVESDVEGGTWLIDPRDLRINSSVAESIENALELIDVTLSTEGSGSDDGTITVDSPVSWNDHILTLHADKDIVINARLDANDTAGLVLEYAQSDPDGDYYVNSRIDLDSTANFSTQKGSNSRIYHIIITELGSTSSSDDGTLQGMSGGLYGNYVLGKNISASATSGWNGGKGFDPVGDPANPFRGNFDGLGHTISSLTIKRPSDDYVGLFGATYGAFVRNVGLTNNNIRGGWWTGSLTGLADNSAIINSYATGDVRASGRYAGGLAGGLSESLVIKGYATGDVRGDAVAGGLVGVINDSIIVDSHATGDVRADVEYAGGLLGIFNTSTLSESYATGDVNGGQYTGGLIGAANSSDIDLSYATGDVSGEDQTGGFAGSLVDTMVADSFGTGDVEGNIYAGGFAGETLDASDLNNVYATGDVSGFSIVGGLVGQSNSNTEIRYAWASGDVDATAFGAGGLAGRNIEGASIRDSWARGEVSAPGIVGGLVGSNTFGASIDNSYSSGLVSGDNLVGGLVGEIFENGVVTDSFWNLATSGQSNACSVNVSACSAVGLTTEQMRQKSTFTNAGWNFSSVWDTDSDLNEGFPYLRASEGAVPESTGIVEPPPPPPPAVTPLMLDSFGDSFTAPSAPYQPTIALSGSGFSDVTEVQFTWTDPNGQTGSVVWDQANNFGEGRFVVSSDSSATIAPVLVAANDPSGTYQWTVTFVAGSQSVSQDFTVSYAGAVTPTPTPTPAPTPTPTPTPTPAPTPAPTAPLSLSSGLSGNYSISTSPYQQDFNVIGTGLSGVTQVTLSWIDPTGETGFAVWDASDNFRDGRFRSSSDTMATLSPVLLVAGDPPGLYQWTVAINNGTTSVVRSFSVNYTAAQLQPPVVNVGPEGPSVSSSANVDPVIDFTQSDSQEAIWSTGTVGLIQWHTERERKFIQEYRDNCTACGMVTEFEITDEVILHWGRNELNIEANRWMTEYTTEDEFLDAARSEGWIQEISIAPEEKEIFHQNEYEEVHKYTHPSGAEWVFDAYTRRLITTDADKGTYNYGANPILPAHVRLDIIPWIMFGSGPNDITTRERREQIAKEAFPEAMQSWGVEILNLYGNISK